MHIWVTGMGCLSALGATVADQLEQLQAGRDGLSPCSTFSTQVGAVALTNDDLRAQLPHLSTRPQNRTALLGMVAAHQAWRSAGQPDLATHRTGLVLGTTVGGMDRTEQLFTAERAAPQSTDLQALYTHSCGYTTAAIADYLGIKGLVTTISTACSSAANAILVGARWIQSGRLDRVFVGGADALTQFTLHGFQALQLLSPQASRPFDAHRLGLNLGEGAGFLVLESDAVAPKDRRLAELVGASNCNDAYHSTASSPQGVGAYQAMHQALQQAELKPQAIDYINTHGTGTTNNDLSEGQALVRLFGQHLPAFGSTKGYTGHTLGAAGGIEAVFSVLALQQQTIFPHLRFETPMPEFSPALRPTTALTPQPLYHVLSNSLGFGGNSTALIFKRPN